MLTQILSEQIEVKATADEAWNAFGGLRLGRILREKLPDVFQNSEILQGDGGAGTVLKITLGGPGPNYMIEKYKVMDDEKRLKIAEIEMGTVKFQIQIKVLENDENTCITEVKVEYEKNGDDEAEKDSVVVASAKSFVATLNMVADTLTKPKEAT